MKAYLVTSITDPYGCCCDYVHGVFSTEVLAQAYIDKKKTEVSYDTFYIEEVEVDSERS